MKIVVEQIEQLAVSPGAAIYTAPDFTTGIIRSAVAANIDAVNSSDITVQVNSGGGLEAYITALTIEPNETVQLDKLVEMGLEAGDILQAFASAANDINLKVTIKEITNANA